MKSWQVGILLFSIGCVCGGCAAKKTNTVRNYHPGVKYHVFIRLKDCKDLPGGQMECKARFEPLTVDAKNP